MFKFFFVIFFFIILLGFLLGFSVLRMLKNILFGSGSKDKRATGQRRTTNNSQAESRSSARDEQEYARSGSRKKIFTKDEGEYVDYEEVK